MTVTMTLEGTALSELAGSFRGQLVRPGDSTYDQHRKIWNGSISRFPALVARCAGVADVIAAVRFAKERGLLVAVRGGGHSFPGLSVCDGGIVIDLSLMKGVRIDPEARTARAQAGVLLGELDRETQAFGLAVPAGIVTHTGRPPEGPIPALRTPGAPRSADRRRGVLLCRTRRGRREGSPSAQNFPLSSA
ncbi:MAG: FAD-binding oxidoreductase [Pseudonocardiaceae bacterium]